MFALLVGYFALSFWLEIAAGLDIRGVAIVYIRAKSESQFLWKTHYVHLLQFDDVIASDGAGDDTRQWRETL